MKTLFRSILAAGFAIAMIVSMNPVSAVAIPSFKTVQPRWDYKTWETLGEVNTDYGKVPFRRGFYDGDLMNRYDSDIVGEGFGLDKLQHKHGIVGTQLPRWVLTNDKNPQYRVKDGVETSTLLWQVRLQTAQCQEIDLGIVCDGWGSYDVIAGAEMNIFDYYYDWPASMTGPDRDNLVPEDEAVGIITLYCDDYDGFCPEPVRKWVNTQTWA